MLVQEGGVETARENAILERARKPCTTRLLLYNVACSFRRATRCLDPICRVRLDARVAQHQYPRNDLYHFSKDNNARQI
jgi:hypothetical protein